MLTTAFDWINDFTYFYSFGSPMDLTARFPSPLAAAAAAAAAGQNAASASTASSLFPYLFSNRNLHNYWLSNMKGKNILKSHR